MTAYYNEIDAQAAQWLRNLIAAGHIAPGDVDTRSIKEVQPDDLKGYTQCHFFAGIGVWSYALRRAGWSDDRPVWTGSCPCQPFSAAGKGEGLDDPRHLWPDWFRLIRERRPLVVFGEQVAGPDGVAWLDLAQADLEEHSHTVGAVITCSAGFGGPDIRQRLYWVADAGGGRPERHGLALAGATRGSEGEGNQRQRLRADIGDGGDIGGLADAHGERFEGVGLHLLERGSRSAVLETAGGSEVGGVGDACGEGLPQRVGEPGVPGRARGDDQGETVERGGVRSRGLADTDGGIEGDGGIQRSGQHGLEPEDGRARGLDAKMGDRGRPGPLNGFWRVADWLLCTDAKWRPVEPGTFPLDTGIAGRLVRLRAYGNALNAEAATEFIRAYMSI